MKYSWFKSLYHERFVVEFSSQNPTVYTRAHTGIGNVGECHLLVVDRDKHAGEMLGTRVRANIIHNPTPTAIFNTLDVLYHLRHPVLPDVITH